MTLFVTPNSLFLDKHVVNESYTLALLHVFQVRLKQSENLGTFEDLLLCADSSKQEPIRKPVGTGSFCGGHHRFDGRGAKSACPPLFKRPEKNGSMQARESPDKETD